MIKATAAFSTQITVPESPNFDLYLKSPEKVLEKCVWKNVGTPEGYPVTVHLKNLISGRLHKSGGSEAVWIKI